MTLEFVPLMLANRNQTEVRGSSRWLGTNYMTSVAQMALVIKLNTGYQSVSIYLVSVCTTLRGDIGSLFLISS